jgi:GDP-L-fucose synthase
MISKKFKKFFKNKKILVTGGTGLIGRELVKYLQIFECNITVVSIDKIKSKIKKVNYIYGDLTNFNFCKKITKNMDYVFHVAGIKGSIDVTIQKPASFFVPLLMMNTNLLEASRLNNVKRLVYTSSIGAYSPSSVFKEKNDNFLGDPMDHYPGWAKRMAEMQIHAYKKQYNIKNFFIVRPCNVYGPGDNFDPKNAMVIPSLIFKILRGDNPLKVWGDGSAKRDFAFSRDVAFGLVQTLYYGTGKNKFLNIGSGKAVSIKKLVKTLYKIKKFQYIFDKKKSGGYPLRVMSITEAKKTIKYTPRTSLYNGLKETFDWFNSNKLEYKKRHNYFK